MSIVVFGAIYLFGIFALAKHIHEKSPLVDENGSPVVVQFRRRRPANTN